MKKKKILVVVGVILMILGALILLYNTPKIQKMTDCEGSYESIKFCNGVVILGPEYLVREDLYRIKHDPEITRFGYVSPAAFKPGKFIDKAEASVWNEDAVRYWECPKLPWLFRVLNSFKLAFTSKTKWLISDYSTNRNGTCDFTYRKI